MPKYQGKYLIESTRLPSWDYTAAGYYFVTLCTKDHRPYFGQIVDGEMHLSPFRKIAHEFWVEIPQHFPNVRLDEFIIMPDHVHGIIEIVETQHAASLQQPASQPASLRKPNEQIITTLPAPGSISTIVRSYKSAVTRWAGLNGHPGFAWQSRFYDRIIRNEDALQQIRQYIRKNPQQWAFDRNNPKNLAIN